MEKQTPAELGETVIDYWQDRLEAEGLRLDVIGVGIDELGEPRQYAALVTTFPEHSELLEIINNRRNMGHARHVAREINLGREVTKRFTPIDFLRLKDIDRHANSRYGHTEAQVIQRAIKAWGETDYIADYPQAA
jgi:hypothetical protein